MKHFKLTSVLAVLVLTACVSSPGGNGNSPDSQPDGSGSSKRVFGTIEFYDYPVQVEMPSSVQQGRPFVVTAVTYGGGCIVQGEMEVKIEGLQAEVRPYDYDNTPAGGDCSDDLRYHKHTATLSFEETSTAEVVFFGQRKNASGVTRTSVTKTLEVR